MTEVPEHLLQRSRERRAALGLGGGEAGAAPSAEVAQTEAASPAPTAAPAEAAPAPPEPEPEPEPAIPVPRARVPVWAMPVLLMLPIWAVVYIGAFGERGEAAAPSEGALLYQANCASCHGAGGGGGTAPALGGVTETFPEFSDHVEWVTEGSGPVRGETYGANNSGPSTGGMPDFGGSLSEEQIVLVVCHERVTFGGEEPAEECAEPSPAEGGEPESAEAEG